MVDDGSGGGGNGGTSSKGQAVESTPLLVDGSGGSSRESPETNAMATEEQRMRQDEVLDAEVEQYGDDREGSAIAVMDGHKKPSEMKLDDYYQMGRYMYVVCLLSQMLLLVEVGDLLFMTYAGAAPKVRDCGTLHFADSMKPDKRCARLEEVWKNETEVNMYGCDRTTVTEKDLDYQFHSVNVEFDELYCQTDRVKMTISIQMVGIIPGSVVFGWLSDAYGRRLVMLGALLCWIASMLAASFAVDLVMFTVIRFIVCFFNAGIAVTLIVFTSEMYPKNHRFCLMNLITWAPNYILFGIIAYFFNGWRMLQRVLAIFALPCIGLILFLSESPRFLISARKMAEAKKAILRMHKMDGRYCDEAMLDQVLEKEHRQMVELSQKKKKYNYFHLFYTWEYALYTLSVSFSLLVVTLITYALIYNMDKLSGSPYLNMILMGAFKYTMNLAIAFADLKFKWLGRKMSHLISECLVIGALAIYVILHLSDIDTKLPYVANALIVAAVGFCGVLFNADKLAGSELFPTGVRNLSCSFGQVCSRVGVVCAPIIFFLKDVCTNDFCFVLPHLTLIVLAALDAFFFQLVVRETKGRPLISEFPSKVKRTSGE